MLWVKCWDTGEEELHEGRWVEVWEGQDAWGEVWELLVCRVQPLKSTRDRSPRTKPAHNAGSPPATPPAAPPAAPAAGGDSTEAGV